MFERDGSADLWEEGLTALFQAGLELALQVQADAMAAETPAERARLAVAFQRLSRSVRHTAALKMRLERDAHELSRRREAKAEEAARARRNQRKARVEAAVRDLIASEPDEDQAEALEQELSERLEREALFDSFLDEPMETQVQRLAQALGLSSQADPSWPALCRPPMIAGGAEQGAAGPVEANLPTPVFLDGRHRAGHDDQRFGVAPKPPADSS